MYHTGPGENTNIMQ